MCCDLWSQYINVRKLFKGGNYLQKYGKLMGMHKIFWLFRSKALWKGKKKKKIKHGLKTPREEIAFTARPKIHSHSQIFSYGWSILSLPHQPNFQVQQSRQQTLSRECVSTGAAGAQTHSSLRHHLLRLLVLCAPADFETPENRLHPHPQIKIPNAFPAKSLLS